jgi:putative membrane-bound dehydrogenase-like protein
MEEFIMTAQCNVSRVLRLLGLVVVWGALTAGFLDVRGDSPVFGPSTEDRFPPLRTPAGFRATLFACDPLVEYPSAIALGPRPGSVFVAVDYLSGLGPEIVRLDEIRLLEDTNDDGYADRSTVWATGFNSIEGLTFHDGTVYAMHSPFLTALRDTNADGAADQRHDLLTGLGLSPQENPHRLHCANGLVMGHDGWLYLALGDHGCDVPRPEGDRLVLEGGGILRCREDGRHLHVFATGLRNIYDVALDEEANVFVRDNENDGGDYKVRVCNSFFGADHGYPYLYSERPDEALPPLADLGLGSSAGGLCYLEDQFPTEYRGNLFFCEWGRAVVRYVPKRAASSFAPLREEVFADGAENDPYGFKPTDLVVERDGSLLVADWADGQAPKRGRGRLYRIRYVGAEGRTNDHSSRQSDWSMASALTELDSTSQQARVQSQQFLERQGAAGIVPLVDALTAERLGVRGRLHAIWILARSEDPVALDQIWRLVRDDPQPSVQAQAVRALADRFDPVLRQQRPEPAPEDDLSAARLAALAPGKRPVVTLEIVVALGRWRWAGAPQWLAETVSDPDLALAHAAMQMLRASGNWHDALRLLDLPSDHPARVIALRALANQYAIDVVDGIRDRLLDEANATRPVEYADLLARVYKRPAHWTYWGYRPAPRPANSVEWERTAAIADALDGVLQSPETGVRLATLRRMQREGIPTNPRTLGRWFAAERDPSAIDVILPVLRQHSPDSTRDLFAAAIASRAKPVASRLAILAAFADTLDNEHEGRLLTLADELEHGPVLAATLEELGKHPRLDSAPLLLRLLEAETPQVRAAALEALAQLASAGVATGTRPEEAVLKMLLDNDAGVRRAAAQAVGAFQLQSATDRLLELASDVDAKVRAASLDGLCKLRSPQAVPLAVAALADEAAQTQALAYLADFGSPDQGSIVVETVRRHPTSEVVRLALGALTAWRRSSSDRQEEIDRAVAEIHGDTGTLVRWRVCGPLPPDDAVRWIEQFGTVSDGSSVTSTSGLAFEDILAEGVEARVRLQPVERDACWLAFADLMLTEPVHAQFMAGFGAPAAVWMNGRQLFEQAETKPFQPDSQRLAATLERGWNRVCVRISGTSQITDFHIRFRRVSSKAEHEALLEASLARTGNAERGRQLFLDARKTQCAKCHRVGDQGERIGPELTGLGGRFSRVHLIESILEPSRTIAPSFQTLVVALKDGRIASGIKVAETTDRLTIADREGNRHDLRKADIAQQETSAMSTMPDGLEKQLTTDEFIDLITFLVAQ